MDNRQIIDRHRYWAFINGYVMAMLEYDLDKERFTDPKERRAAENATIYHIVKKSLHHMIADCEKFCGKFRLPDHIPHYDMGYRFWMSRQLRGIKFTDFGRGPDTCDADRELYKEMDAYAEKLGECYPEIYRGWIYV